VDVTELEPVDGPVRLSCCTVDPVRRVVERDDGRVVRLTAQEADTFVYLAGRANMDVPREDLLEHVWGYRRDIVTRAVDNAIARLRSKIEEDTRDPAHLLTVRGKGYRLVLPETEEIGEPTPTWMREIDSDALSPLRSMRGGPIAPEGQVAIATAVVHRAEALWQAAPAAMADASEVCDRLLRVCLIEVDGYEVRSDTAGFMAAFPTTAGAVQWAFDAQRILRANRWPKALLPHLGPNAADGLMVGMGLDLGEPLYRRDPVTRRMEYFGPMVNRTGQLARLARPGEVLVTAALAEASVGRGSIEWRSMGGHELVAGSGVTTELMQMQHPDLAHRVFPVLGAAGVHPTNVPAVSNAFIGRAADVDALDGQVRAGARWVTVSGPAGAGKSRLVREVAPRWVADLPGGVWLCDAAAAVDEVALADAIARTLGLPIGDDEGQGNISLGTVMASLGRMVLVLDDFDALVASCSEVLARWLKEAPELQLVVTSRALCQMGDEVVVELTMLSVDEAVHLFEVRARDVQRGFALDDESRSTAIRIVEVLDAIPLAIELAAARMRMMNLRELAEGLEARRSEAESPPPRHLTLRDAIDWSWQLLDAAERQALAQCSLFAGGFDLDAAESVIGLSDAGTDAESTVLDTVESLQDQSLIQLRESALAPGTPRFHLPCSVRAFATDRLAELDPGGDAQRRHVAYFSHLMRSRAEDTDPSRLALELPNARAALAHEADSDPSAAAALATSLSELG
jgi:predicted ATPase/DNA-binding winged helix-turn-helix (wHTH) protein